VVVVFFWAGGSAFGHGPLGGDCAPMLAVRIDRLGGEQGAAPLGARSGVLPRPCFLGSKRIWACERGGGNEASRSQSETF